ncbi:MAG: glycosyltransferase family 9 protein [Tepidisphaeraceae bacterium]
MMDFKTLLNNWPRSAPDYRWPDQLMSARWAALRWALSALFHAAYAVGLLVSRVWRGNSAVLVIRTDGLGDAVLFEPALETLAQSVSPCDIHYWAPRLSSEALRACPSIHRRLTIPRGFKDGNLGYFFSPMWRIKLGYNLGRWEFDKVIYPAESPEPLGNWLFVSARAVERWLNDGDLDNQFDWQRARTHERATRILERRPGDGHELLRNGYIAGQWGAPAQMRWPRIHVDEHSFDLATHQVSRWRRTARRHNASGIVALVPGSATVVNHYPACSWADVARRLWADHRVMCALFGSPDDEALLTELTNLLADIPHLLMSRPMSIPACAATIRRLDGVLSVDTGLAHIAVAQNTPAVVLRAGGHPGRFFPWPRETQCEVLFHEMPCEGCRNVCSLSEPECITHVTPRQIVEAYLKLRQRQQPMPMHEPATPLRVAV